MSIIFANAFLKPSTANIMSTTTTITSPRSSSLAKSKKLSRSDTTEALINPRSSSLSKSTTPTTTNTKKSFTVAISNGVPVADAGKGGN
ncbi:hypothetical protein HDU76_013996, partial [Blyttiomyces sp. JEL0837]